MKNQITMLKESIERASNEGFIIYNCGGISDNKKYIVINENNQKAYNVEVEDNKVVDCDCPHHIYRKSSNGKGVICKHMIKIAMEKNLDII